LDVDTIFGDLRRECLHQRVVRNTIFRKAPPSVVSGYGKRSINVNKVVATFEKHIFLSQTDLTRTVIISNSYNEMFEADEWDRVVALPRHKFVTGATLLQLGDTKQSLLESTTEITQNKHVKELHYFVDDIK
jgi:hypothetical protein